MKHIKKRHKTALQKVAPPRGERGLKLIHQIYHQSGRRRSPSWGAWIETHNLLLIYYRAIVAPPRGERGLKHMSYFLLSYFAKVAPPRGERGLKQRKSARDDKDERRSPSWGAWIETFSTIAAYPPNIVAPPRGERGLKLFSCHLGYNKILSLPLVGSVD